MGLLEGKSWAVQDFYNEYLKLKIEIPELVNSRNHFKMYNKHNEIKELQTSIDVKVNRLKFVLDQLELNRVSMQDLIFLSIGIDVE